MVVNFIQKIVIKILQKNNQLQQERLWVEFRGRSQIVTYRQFIKILIQIKALKQLHQENCHIKSKNIQLANSPKYKKDGVELEYYEDKSC